MTKNQEKSFEGKALITVLLVCALPQILRIILNFIYAYEIEGNISYGAVAEIIFGVLPEVLGKISFFSVMGCAIYLALIGHLKTGVEWTLMLTVTYGMAYALLYTGGDYRLVMSLFFICTAATVFACIYWLKSHKKVMVSLVATLCLSILGGVIVLYASYTPSVDEIIEGVFYGTVNLGFEMLMIVGACIMANALGKRRVASLSVSGKLISLKNPAMLTMLVFSLLFVLLSAISPTVEIVQSIIEYGPPVNTGEWLSIVKIYAELIIIFVIGYLSMRFGAGRLEGCYIQAEDGN